MCLWGVVHDPLAREMNGGVSGNAGVFSTSEDLARLAIWMFGTLDGRSKGERSKGVKNKDSHADVHTPSPQAVPSPYLRGRVKKQHKPYLRGAVGGPFGRETLEMMLRVPEGYEQFGRTLAWGVWEGFLEDGVESGLSPKSVYHTGYTGTFMVVDPEQKIAVILLAHRVHPHDQGSLYKLRCEVVEAVVSAKLRN